MDLAFPDINGGRADEKLRTSAGKSAARTGRGVESMLLALGVMK